MPESMFESRRMFGRWMLLLGWWLASAACASDPDEPQDETSERVTAPDGGSTSADAGDRADAAVEEDADSAVAMQDPEGQDPEGADCDEDPHHPDCIDTHVRGQCEISSGFPGDEACLAPPEPGTGVQIHVGPTDYDDPDEVATFILEPGDESSECWSLETPNEEDLFYQSSTLSGRPGTHHIINTGYTSPNPEGSEGRFAARCRGESDDATISVPGASKPYMPRFRVAPENEGLGYPLPAHTAVQSDMHYFNYTDEPILREYWLNLYTVPEEQVTERPNRIRGWGGITWFGAGAIQPGTDMVYEYSCPIDTDGRITLLLGHTHSHAVRFTAWVRRQNGDRLKVFEAYDYLEPQIYAYNSIETNPDFSDSSPGAHTGPLEVSAGDALEWECHVVNDSDVGLTFTNYVDTGEMCNIWGVTVGPVIDCVL